MDQQVLQCLQATLSPEDDVRHTAEEQLKQLFLLPDGSLSLARLLVSPEVALAQRQMSFTVFCRRIMLTSCIWRFHSAGVLLQQYITQHWTPAWHNFQEPITPHEVKAQLRSIVFHGLSDPQRKVRMASAFAISTIARFDSPDDWPDLLSSLVSLLTSGSVDSVHGSMRVIAEFVKNDVSDDQLQPVIQNLAPALLVILGSPQSHTYATRASTVNVFRQIVRMLETVRDEHPQAVKSALEQIAPVWFGAFTQLLSIDAASEVGASWEALGLRIEIFRTLSFFQSTFPRVLAPYLDTYLRLSLINLTSLLSIFTIHYISSDPDAPEPPSPTSDAGFVTAKMDIDDLACAIFDFLTPAVRTAKAVPYLVEGAAGDERGTALMDSMIGIVMAYTQVTRENEEEWLEDANAFVADDDEETELYGLRVNGFDLVGSLMDKWPRAVAKILQDQTNRRVQESAGAKESGKAEWWKPLESALALLGGVSDDLRELLDKDQEERRAPAFNISHLFDQVIPGLLALPDTPFLQGRAFVLASQFAAILPEGLASQYLAAAVHALESPSVTVPVKISAVKTIKNFCRFINAEVMKPQSQKILTLLLPLLQQTTNETLYLLLETVRAVIALDKDLLTEASTVEMAERVYEVWFKYTTDPVLTAIVEELFEAMILLALPVVTSTLVHHVAPKLAVAISEPVTDDTIHLPGEAVQLANSLIRNRAGPLEEELVGSITAAVLGCLTGTDDMDVIQHGMIHLTLVVRKDCDKLIQWRDPQGHNGIASIFALLGRFLAPTFSESGGIFVGDLIMHLFRKASGAIAPVLGDLLRAVVNRLVNSSLPSFVQSLVLPFAYLFGTEHTQSTIDLLSSFTVNLPDGQVKSALDVVLSAWCETSDTITGSWNIRVSNLGMLKLFIMPFEGLQNVIVKGDLIISESNRNTIMTRSRTKITPNQYTQIPFPVKALKLLLKDVQSVEPSGSKSSGKGKTKASDLDIEEDDGDDDWDDDDPLGDAEVGEFDYLSSWIDTRPGDHDAQDDDEDLRSDPVAQIDMGQYLTDALRQAYAGNVNGMHGMIESLSDQEKAILRSVLTV